MNEINKSDFFAIIIGFNRFNDRDRLQELRYAEKDAKDIYNVLIDPNFGDYPKENINLITGEYTQDDIEELLYTKLVMERTKEDIVFVYYSGHGFLAGDQGNAYLATPQVTITQILNNPLAGLRMNYLHDELFMKTKAKQVIFILDCCHSGAFFTPGDNKDITLSKPLIENNYYTSKDRVAFVSSPKGVTSRENSDFENGIFTSYLLLGLRGDALEDFADDRAVTMGSLVSYVQAKTPPSQKPVFYGQSGRIVLTQPKILPKDIRSEKKYPIFDRSMGLSRKVTDVYALSNPIDEHVEFIEKLINNLRDTKSDSLVSQRILEVIRKTVSGELISIISVNSNNNLRIKFSTDFIPNKNVTDKIQDEILQLLFPTLIETDDFLLEYRFGFVKPYNSKIGKKKNCKLVIIPLRIIFPREFLVVLCDNEKILENGQVMGRLLLSIYEASNELTSLNIDVIENKLLDDIKKIFGYVPRKIYDHRLDIFKNYLGKINFAFEPIINLGKVNPQIDSWEALARDPLTGKAPFYLFDAAKLWGNNFIKELDLYCLENAVSNYVDLWISERGGSRKDPLSVNVYPQTIFTPEYKEEVIRIVKQKDILKPKELILEISERLTLPSPPPNSQFIDKLGYFEDKLHEYTDDVGIVFAVDDFGSGHSSIGRLMKLELDHIKIDREVLSHRSPLHTIEYVLKSVKNVHVHHTNVVVEGYDGSANVSLSDLFDSGVEYIQGHLLRRAGYSLKELDKDTKEFILNELSKSNKKQAELNFTDDVNTN